MVNRACGIISTNYSREDFSLLTTNRPIASIPFGARYRLVDFPLSNMVNSNITSVGLITPHMYRSIIDHVGSGKEWGLSIKNGGLFILPGTTYGFDIGKGKVSVRDIKNNDQFLHKTKEEYVVISASNKIFNIDYNEPLDFHIKNHASITFIYKNMDATSNADLAIELDGNKVKSIVPAKKKKVNMFLDSLIIDKEILFKLLSWYADKTYLDIVDIINENLSHLKVYAYEFTGYVAPINNLNDYMNASRDLFKPEVMKEVLFGERIILTKIHDAPPVKYGENAKVSSSILGTGAKVFGEVKNSIVFRASIIEENAKIDNCVIMQGAVVKKGAILSNVILEKDAIVGENAEYHGTLNKPLIITRMQN